jgi:hypothetical protein
MKQERLRTLVSRRFGNYLDAPSDFRVNCPYCPRRGHSPDTDHKLYISWSKEMSHCFRCDYAGPISRIFEDEVITLEKQRQEMLEQRKEEFRKSVEERQIELVPKEAVAFSSLHPEHPAFKYMYGRIIVCPCVYTAKRKWTPYILWS